MQPSTSSTSACRHCRSYVPQGRRGGHCKQLNVAVQSSWKACTLAIPPFTPTWENIEELMVWQQQALAVQSIPPCPEESVMTATVTGSPRMLQPTTGIKALWM